MAMTMNGAYFNGMDTDEGLQRALDNIPGSVTTDYILFNLNVASGTSADINYGWTGPLLASNGVAQPAVGKLLTQLVTLGTSRGQLQRIWLTMGSATRIDNPEPTETFKHIQMILNTGGVLQQALFDNFAAIVSAIGQNAAARTIGFDLDCEEMDLPNLSALLAKLTVLLCVRVPNCPITFCPFSDENIWIGTLKTINSQMGRQPVAGFNLQTYSGGRGNDPPTWTNVLKAAQGTGVANPDNFIWPIVSNSPDAKPYYQPGDVPPLLKGWRSPGASLWDTMSLTPSATLTDYSKAIAAGIKP